MADNRLEVLKAYAEEIGRAELIDEINEIDLVARAEAEAKAAPEVPSKDAQYRNYKVLKTIEVAADAGWNPYVVINRDTEASRNAETWVRWRRELEDKMRSLIEHFETSDMSSMDMMQVADGLTRMMDKILVKKHEAGTKAKAELAALERTSYTSKLKPDDDLLPNQSRSNNFEWEDRQQELLERRIKLLRDSYFKFQQGYEVALLARSWTDGYTGSNWSAYIPDHAMRDLNRKQKKDLQLRAFRVALEGKDRQAYDRALSFYVARLDGIDSDDGMGGTADKKKEMALRQHQTRLAAKKSGYRRSERTAVPKQDVKVEPSGEPGSRYISLVKSQTG